MDMRPKKVGSLVVGTVGALLAVAAVVALLTTFAFPMVRIVGSSMAPTLKDGELMVSAKSSSYQSGDIVAFYSGDKVLVKRVICGPGDWVDMQEDGTVFVNNQKVDEPYVSKAGFGDCNIALPYQVPEASYFVMGDQRMTSVDSRMSQVGCVPQGQIVGKVVLRVWPPNRIGAV